MPTATTTLRFAALGCVVFCMAFVSAALADFGSTGRAALAKPQTACIQLYGAEADHAARHDVDGGGSLPAFLIPLD